MGEALCGQAGTAHKQEAVTGRQTEEGGRDFDLAEVARDAVRAVTSDGGVHVTVAGDVRAEVDARRVHTILRNLVANALQHGAPPVDVAVEGHEDLIVVTVTDSGAGIEESLIPTIFHRFARADTSRNAQHTSTGLGLAIALENTRLHDASLTVSTAERTAFTLRVPRRSALS